MTVIDAYCGMGSITLNIARRVKKVYGIEIVPSAIENAKENMKLNNITNAELICGHCEEEIVKLVNQEKINAIFFDPPRKDCEQKFLDTVNQMEIPQIVYISCNVATCARDCAYLEENGYKVVVATPVDLFSRTRHVEVIAVKSKKTA
jgi:23S rRNA (uracil1939-C5)-methyltransferase